PPSTTTSCSSKGERDGRLDESLHPLPAAVRGGPHRLGGALRSGGAGAAGARGAALLGGAVRQRGGRLGNGVFLGLFLRLRVLPELPDQRRAFRQGHPG